MRLQDASSRRAESKSGPESDQGARGARYAAVIVDGHRRWAQSQGVSLHVAYDAGVSTALARARDAVELGVRELTYFCFSVDNWRRSTDDVQAFMEIAERRIVQDTPQLAGEGMRLRFIGDRSRLPRTLAERMDWAEQQTCSNLALTLFLAFNYGGRQEIEEAARRLAESGGANLREHLYAPDMHDPDLLIRTGGDRRLSNFMLWRLAYTELVFRDEYWPDFSRECFEQALAEFATRRRRYGGD